MTETLQIWANDDRDQFALCIEGDQFMRHQTTSGILYPHLVDSFAYGEQDPSTPDEILDAWVESHKGDR